MTSKRLIATPLTTVCHDVTGLHPGREHDVRAGHSTAPLSPIFAVLAVLAQLSVL